MADKAQQRNGFWLDKAGDEYASVRYYSDMCLGGDHDIANLDVWKIVNEEHALLYNREHEGRDRVVSWKSVKEIPPIMLKTLGKEGFTFDSSPGMSFTVGNIGLPARSTSVKIQEHSYVYSETVLGRACAVDEAGLRAGVPGGFDSAWVSPTLMDANNDGVFSLTEYRGVARFGGRHASKYAHRYVVRDCRAILPKYVVKLQVVPTGQNTTPAASQQQRTRAASCFVEPASLTVVPMEDVKNIRQGMLPAGQVYDQAIMDLYKDDPLSVKKKAALESLLNDLDDKVRDVNVHYAEGFETIQRAAEAATRELQLKTRQKLEEVLSIEVELRRQSEHLEWMERHMARQAQASAADKPRLQTVIQQRGLIAQNEAGDYGGTVATPDVLDFLAQYKAYLGYRHVMTRAKPGEVIRQLDSLATDITVVPEIGVFRSRVESVAASEAKAMVLAGASNPTTAAASAYNDLMGGSSSGVAVSIPGGAKQDKIAESKSKEEINRRRTLRSSVWGRSSSHNHLVEAMDVAHQGMAPVAQFIMKAVESDAFGEPPSLGRDDGLRDEARPAMDDAMKRIAKALYEAQMNKDVPLPPSLLRPGVMGDQYMVDMVRREAAGLTKGAMHSSKALRVDPGSGLAGRFELGGEVRRRASGAARQRGDTHSRIDAVSVSSHKPGGTSSHALRAGALAMSSGAQPMHTARSHTAPQSGLDAARTRAMAMAGQASMVDLGRGHTAPVSAAPSRTASANNTHGRSGGIVAGSVGSNAGASMTGSVSHTGVTGAIRSKLSVKRAKDAAAAAAASSPGGAAGMTAITEDDEDDTSTLSGGVNVQGPMSPTSPLTLDGHQTGNVTVTSPNGGLEPTNLLSPLYDSSRHTEKAVLRGTVAATGGALAIADEVAPETQVHLTQRYARSHGLSGIQEKRGRQLESRLSSLAPELVFQDTELMGMNDAQKIYLCLPFMSKPPLSKCIFSTLGGSPRSLGELYAASAKVDKPVVMVIRSGAYTFGAYLSAALQLNGIWNGSPSSFLFSLTLDLRLPYHGQCVPNLNKPDPSHTYAFYADVDQLVIGNGDLVLNQDLSRGSTELEGCFGVGLGVGSADAQHLLAGSSTFDIDDIEVWCIL